MTTSARQVVIGSLRGGRNGVDSPLDPQFPMDQAAEAVNVDYTEGAIGRRRGGSSALSLTGGTASSSGFQKLMRHIPGGSETGAELWSIDGAATPHVKRLAGGTTWADVVMSENPTSTRTDIQGVSLNGKFFLFYGSSIGRLHVYDPTMSSVKVRVVGLKAPAAAPTAANTGAGAYPATLRYYRVRWLHLNGTIVVRRSEPGPSLSFTPSGAGTGVIVTRPTAASEEETHWELEVSVDNLVWYQLRYGSGTAIVIGTTTYTDTALTSSYGTLTASDLTGTYALLPPAKYGITDGNRLIVAGSYDTSVERDQSSVWVTPVLGSLDQGDDERWLNRATQKLKIPTNQFDGGDITGLGGPINGVFWAFKYRQIIRFTPTGDDTKPFITRRMSYTVGSIHQNGVVLAEDSDGNPCLYFLSAKGPYRLGPQGLQYCGRDIEDVWFGRRDYAAIGGVNLSATNVTCGKYYSDRGLIIWLLSVGTGVNSPNTAIVLNTRDATRRDKYGIRGGWSVWNGSFCAADTMEMFANTVAASMSYDLKPYVGKSTTVILKGDVTSVTSDDGTGFQAYSKTRSIFGADALDVRKYVHRTTLFALPSASTIQQNIDINSIFPDKDPIIDQVTLNATGSESRVVRTFNGAELPDAQIVQIVLGDPDVRAAPSWSLDAIVARVSDDSGPSDET